MKQILLWMWCFPQNLLGFAVKCFTKAEKKGNHYRYNCKLGSVCIGEYIFLYPNDWRDITALKHENGHRVQSRILGWFYIPAIRIPSMIHNWRFRKSGKEEILYYSFYTEKWADQIAGIDRSKE